MTDDPRLAEWSHADGIAAKIARDVFTDGAGTRASRLVMETRRPLVGAGWSETALADRIAANMLPLLEACNAVRLRLTDLSEGVRLTDCDIEALERLGAAYESLTDEEPTDGE